MTLPNATEATTLANILSSADLALAVNTAYLAIPSPTQAQAIAQVDKLTRECSGIIRILRGQWGASEGI
jgi:hypothetical protein